MSIREGFALYYGHMGFKGVMAIAAYRLTGLPKRIKVKRPEILHPIEIRIGTTDASIYRSVVRLKEYEFDLPFVPKTIVDAGANIGMASVYFANKYVGARIVAVEAERSNFQMLCRNSRLYPQITTVHAALWNRDGQIAVMAPAARDGRSGEWAFVTREGPGERVRAMTMETLMRETWLQSIDILKVDIEGSEFEVFSSCGWIEKVRCVMVELHDRFKPGCSGAVAAAMKGFSRSQRGETILYLRP